MLDQDTKRKIDNARDILVGKVPDPKSQVEQITIALIYKFMDDMDKESEEWGGEATFFTGEFEKYAWSKIFDPRLGGYDLIGLYGDAIIKMNQNPNIPQLFRDIFKNAYLPYRDPETLKSFLKEINDFTYDHSERLGDAFEYLLSVMDSQGDAGQFRTPRHIIDFIVEIVNPQKIETVLDPACGSAGFLISSYKHILKNNTKNRPGDRLTPEQRNRLMNNFMGYDISPDMVRLSLVNLYLHGFSDPTIVEYDTLTSEERWNDTADVVLANPPFMTPKGGIRPHKRFSIQANRSEVLFVDYIAEHLNANGRAGVIVPEGIIFQSSNAYKNLRKMLVENFLWAVVSLPAGVFQPYSGVKTSILLMDRLLAKKTDKILFVKINNDGFDLGAQRRPIDKNDLPEAVNYLKLYRSALLDETDMEDSDLALAVEKEKIGESGDWNLSSSRYLTDLEMKFSAFEMVKLDDVCEIYNGSTPSRKDSSFWKNGTIPWFTIDDIREQGREIFFTKQSITYKALSKTSVKLLPKNTVLLCCTASVGEYAYTNIELTTNQQFNGLVVNKKNKDRLYSKFLFVISVYFKEELIRLSGKTSFNFVSVGLLKEIKIPLPPLEIQKAIVAEIENYQKIIDGARQVVENYKPTIKINPDWEMVELNNICDVRDGTHDSPKYQSHGYPLITTKNIKEGTIDFSNANLISKEDLKKVNERSGVDNGDIIMPMIGTIGNPIVVKKDREFAIKNVALIKFIQNSKIDRHFLKLILESEIFNTQYKNASSGSTQKFISLKFIRSLNPSSPQRPKID
jgi:type I restriction enzyme M protein